MSGKRCYVVSTQMAFHFVTRCSESQELRPMQIGTRCLELHTPSDQNAGNNGLPTFTGALDKVSHAAGMGIMPAPFHAPGFVIPTG